MANIPTPTPSTGLQRIATGVAGLTRAALHVDRTPEVELRRRRGTCAACPRATAGSARTSRCSVCACFIHPKTALASEHCPQGLW